MGVTLNLFSSNKVQVKTVFSRRISIERAETFHIHYRNMRLELSESNFRVFAKSLVNAYNNYLQNTGIQVEGQVFLDLNEEIDDTKLIKPEELKIELCRNLYKENIDNIFGRYAEFYNDAVYFHIHFRDIRLGLSIEDFFIFSSSILESYLSYTQLTKRGFKSVKEVFEILNDNDVRYVVMRNWKDLIVEGIDIDHPDIDLMIHTEDLAKFNSILATTNTSLEGVRVQKKILVSGKDYDKVVFIDARSTRDNYYPDLLADELLAKRIRKSYFFIPDDKTYFLTLLYHAHFHKPQLHDSYFKILERLIRGLSIEMNSSQLREKQYVREFLFKMGYKIVRPYDTSVQFFPL